ncbi:hypothetical protein SY88_16115 [Clostridiales bacterium PH28_bin88]|nr:hypothetical protein SY88_16115 [Clostridiales bacterium PH28_bin88]
MDLGIYIHIPFCLRKCNYCDFISYPGCDEDLKEQYIRAVIREASLYRDGFKDQERELTSIYVGGGTPTLLKSGHLTAILDACRQFPWREGIEISIEANPGTVAPAKLADLRAAGYDRLSLGAQSFQDRLLAEMGRVHSAAKIIATFDAARHAGFDNINLDLIYGLPNQSRDDWQETLERAVALRPEHIAAYGLKVEEGTPWGRLQREGRLCPAGEDLSVEMYLDAIEFLGRAGYRHYEISNFALPGRPSVHNLLYWRNQEYIGLGVASSGHLHHRRYTNTGDLSGYISQVNEGRLPVAESEDISRSMEMAETMFLGLRLLDGVNLEGFYRRFGVRAEDVYACQIARMKELNMLIMEDGCLRLTSQALPVSNEVFAQFL